MTRDLNVRTSIVVVFFVCFIGLYYIISSSFLPLNGNHMWRQSDVYSHILSFMKIGGFNDYDRFVLGTKAIFDIPVYQYFIANIALLSDAHPLVVTRLLNSFIWIASAWSGYNFCKNFGGNNAGVCFLLMLSTSPLIHHYYSVPLPDTLSIGLCLIGLNLLMREKLLFFLGAFLFCVAALIKSPIAYVFIVFYTLVYLLQIKSFKRESFKKHIPLICTLIFLLITAIFAEYLRTALLDKPSNGLVNGASWYFGSLELRGEFYFWDRIVNRLNSSGPFEFSLIYFLVTFTSFILLKNRLNFIIAISSFISFLTGWLTFSNVYFIHDYYQLPVMVIIFISFSVSLSLLVNEIFKKFGIEKRIYFQYTLPVLAIFILMNNQSFSDRRFEREENAYSFILKSKGNVLYVQDDPNINNPSYGGRITAKTKIISREDFEANCNKYVESHPNIIAKYNSVCLNKNRGLSSTFISHNGSILYIKKEKPKLENFKLVSTSSFNIYMNNKSILFSKENCQDIDIQESFFLHIIPEDKSSLPSNAKHDFLSLDFNFDKKGFIIDNQCFVSIKLPNFKIKGINTGQYIREKGRVWEVSIDSIQLQQKDSSIR